MEMGCSRLLALRKRSARQELHASSPPKKQDSKVTCFLDRREEGTPYHPLMASLHILLDILRFPKLPFVWPILSHCGVRGAVQGVQGALQVESAERSWMQAASSL